MVHNTLLGGFPDETLSARSYRLRQQSKAWYLANKGINALFFWQSGHTYTAYLSEKQHDDLPEIER